MVEAGHVIVIGGRCLTQLPGWEDAERHLQLGAGGKGHYVDLLEHGELMGVAVGGAREALFDSDYSADWGGRAGFAKVRCY